MKSDSKQINRAAPLWTMLALSLLAAVSFAIPALSQDVGSAVTEPRRSIGCGHADPAGREQSGLFRSAVGI